MNQRIGLVAAVSLFAVMVSTAQNSPPNPPQSPGQNTQQDNQNRPGGTGGAEQSQMLTGCIHKSTNANEFTLATQDGNSWTLVAREGTNLNSHVGHTVTVTGTPRGVQGTRTSDADTQRDSTQRGATTQGSSAAARGQLTVTSVTMVSPNCQSANQNRNPNQNNAPNPGSNPTQNPR